MHSHMKLTTITCFISFLLTYHYFSQVQHVIIFSKYSNTRSSPLFLFSIPCPKLFHSPPPFSQSGLAASQIMDGLPSWNFFSLFSHFEPFVSKSFSLFSPLLSEHSSSRSSVCKDREDIIQFFQVLSFFRPHL